MSLLWFVSGWYLGAKYGGQTAQVQSDADKMLADARAIAASKS